jgi:hypothetical protein
MLLHSALAESVEVGIVKADTGNAFLDTVIVIVVVLVLAVGLGLIRRWLKT